MIEFTNKNNSLIIFHTIYAYAQECLVGFFFWRVR